MATASKKTPVHEYHSKGIIAKEDATFGSFATPAVLLSSKNLLKDSVSSARHSRSRSAPENSFDMINKAITPMNSQLTQLPYVNKRLQVDRAVTHSLQKGKTQSSAVLLHQHHNITPEAKGLVDEIGFLEEEIADLEQYVLTLYRGFFNRCLSRSSSIFYPKHKSDCPDVKDGGGQKGSSQQQDHTPKKSPKKMPMAASHDSICVSIATQCSSTSKVASPAQPKTRHAPMLCESIDVARHSQIPLSENPQQSKAPKCNTVKSNILSLDEDGPRPLRDYLSEPPNQLSEDLVRCMTTIYCKLSDPPSLSSLGVPESPLSCASSSTSLSSIHGMFSDGWSPRSRIESTYDTPLIDPFQVKGKLGRTGAYSCMVEVPHICMEKDRLNHASRMLRDFRSMVEKLEKVNPRQLKHDEKLAFWINVYNALLMHAYLAYGIPRNSLKRMALIQKASYKVGGHSINAHTIEHHILRCRSHRPTQWLQNLLSPGSKFKAGDGRRMFAIDRPEPLVCFALCCGGRSDPAVRVYTAKNVHGELEASMREFLQASIGFHNNRKVLLPKILEWYTREAPLPHSCLLDWVSQYVNDQDRESLQRCIQFKPHKSASHCIEWVSYNFNFRYIFDRDLMTRFPSHMH